MKLRTSCSDQSPSFLRSEPLSSTRRVLPACSSDFAWRCTDPQTRAALCAELSRERLPARQRSAACVILPSLRACAASFRVFNDRVVLLTPRERHCPLLARRRNSFPVSRADAAGFLPGRSLVRNWARLNLRGCCQNSLRRGRADHFIPHEILAGEGLVEAGYSADEVCRKVREKSR